MPDWTALRAEFPLLERYIYFNACSLGPLPRRGRDALARYAHDWDEQGTPVWYSTWLPLLARFRSQVGELLRAPAGSTAIAPSVSVALTTLATGLPLPEGRRKVLIGELDFPTIGHQWLSRPEFEVEFVPSRDGMTIPPEAFAERIDEQTALVATTHLFYTTGYLQNVRAIADAAHANKLWVGVCGEMAGDVALVPLLLGLGMDELSAAATLVPRVKRAVQSLTIPECRELVEETFKLNTASEILARCLELADKRYGDLLG